MAYAVVTLSYGVPTTTPSFIRMLLDVVFFGDDVPGPGRDFASVQVEIPGNATATTIRNQITAAVTAEADQRQLKLVGNGITIPTFSKG